MQLLSYLLAAIGSMLFLASIPYQFWASRPGVPVKRRALLLLGRYMLIATAGLLLLQLWVEWRTTLLVSVCLIPAVPAFALGEWIWLWWQLASVSRYEKLAEQARLEGKLKLAHMYEETVRRIRGYHGECSE